MDPWVFLPIGYLVTIAIETPVLLLGLAPQHAWRRRLGAGVWLTACTYPVVILVLPPLLPDRGAYLAVAESFAPLAECALFRIAFGPLQRPIRDLGVIALANLASFGLGELWYALT